MVFNLLDAKLGGQCVKAGEQVVEVVHQLVGRKPGRYLGEADEVGEQHRHRLEAVGDRGFAGVHSDDDGLGEDAVQQVLGLVLGLLQGALGFLLLGDIADDAGEEELLAAPPMRQRQLQREHLAVVAQALELDGLVAVLVVALLARACDAGDVLAVILAGHQPLQRFAQQLRPGVTEDLLGAAVPRNDAPAGIDRDDRVVRRLRHRAKAFLALTQRFLGTLALGDVETQDHGAAIVRPVLAV